MKVSRSSAAIVLALCVLAAPAAALSLTDLKVHLQTARTKLLTLLETKEKAAQDKLIAQIRAASDKVDAGLVEILSAQETPEPDRTALEAFRTDWQAFKETRDKQIIPAVKEGADTEARATAQGVQLKRYDQMIAVLDRMLGIAKKPKSDASPAH